MKLTKRLLALLLAVLMLPVWNPTVAQAVELPSFNKAETGTIPARVNPHYADIYTVDDFDRPELPKPSVTDINPNATYVTIEQGITQMRNNLKNRAATFTINVQTTISNANNVANTLFYDAMLHTGNPTEGDYLQWHWATVEASYASSYNGSAYLHSITFGMTYYTTAAQEKTLDTAVKNLLSSLNLSGKSDYAKIKAVYDYICDNITYDYTNLNDDSYTLKYSAYAAMINKTAVCQGYALLFYRLMLELGIDARFIGGIGNGGPHGWNIVELNGLYYNVDSTWDAGVSSYNFFLLNAWNFVDHYRFLDYETWEFHEEYPMAAENYQSGVTGEIDPYIYIDYCGDNAAFAVERNGTLTIAGEGETYDYYPGTSIEDDASPWHFWGDHITKLVVEDGITVLGESTFYQMTSLKSIKLPNTLTEIESRAFENCSSLSTVKIPEGVTRLERGAFLSSGVTSLTLPDTLITIDNEAFRWCEKLKTVTIPENVTYVGNYAFGGCLSLDTIYFLGDAPEFFLSPFANTTATAYYPMGNDTWTADVLQDYEGDITWVAQASAPVLTLSNVASTGKVKISWEPVGGAEKYEVYYSTDKATWKKLATTTNSSVTHTSGTAGTLYYYKVRIISSNSAGNSEFSLVHSKRCDLPRPVLTLSNVASTGKNKISWKAISGAVKYEVYYSTDKTNWTKLSTTTSTSVTHTGAKAGTLYYYRVKAIASNANANSAYSLNYSLRCDLARPTLTLTNVASTGKVKVSWPAVTGAVKYELYASTDKANWTKVTTVTGTSATHDDGVAGTLYYYRVRAIASNSNANSAYSLNYSMRCDLARPVLTMSNVASTGKVKVSWAALNGAVKYEVYYSTDKTNWTKLTTTTGTSVTHTDSTAGTLYYYRVKAIASNANANSAYSLTYSQRGDLPRTTLTLSNIASTGKVKISWAPIDGAVNYEVYASTDKANWTKICTTTDTSAIHTDGVAGTLYYYRVRAIASNANANSAYSLNYSMRCDLAQPVLTMSNDAASGKVKVSWEALYGAVEYQVYVSTDKTNWTKICTTTDASAIHTDGVAGTLYYYRVRAIAANANANSVYSLNYSQRCDLAQPVLTLSYTAGVITVAWDEIDGAVAYDVYCSTDASSWTKLGSIMETGLDHSDVTAGTTYYYRVRAIASNANANSAYSAVAAILAE